MRRQVPAYSPLRAGALVAAVAASLRRPENERDDLERHLADRFDAERARCTGSGTQALQAVLAAVRASRPGPVAVPAFSCYDIVTACVGARVPVRFYDVDPDTLTPDLDDVRRTLVDGAAAVVAGSLYGLPLDWDALRALADEAGAVLIEDAAQALGSSWRGRGFGTFGDATVLSFGRGKGWTGGAGGALLLRGEGAQLEASLPAPTRARGGVRVVTATAAQWALGRPSLYGIPSAIPGLGLGETRYKEPVSPARIGAFEAAAVLRHAEAAAQAAAGRRAWTERWLALLAELDTDGRVVRPCRALRGGESGAARAPAVAASGGAADGLLREAGPFGVTRSYPRALPDLPQRGHLLESDAGACAGARLLASSLVTFPTHEMVGKRDVLGVREAVAAARGSP